MAKRVELIYPSKSHVKVQNFDWNLCCLCQENTEEKLVCSASKSSQGYKTFAENVAGFVELGSLPMPLDLSMMKVEV